MDIDGLDGILEGRRMADGGTMIMIKDNRKFGTLQPWHSIV